MPLNIIMTTNTLQYVTDLLLSSDQGEKKNNI
jgi:hypothetical protein